MLYNILLTFHLCASIVWVGSVFMGTFIDWPASRESVKKGHFPLQFIIGQAKRVFYSVYAGIVLLWVSGIGLMLLNPPQTSQETVMTGMKIFALFIMTSFTLYGTISTWPKMQFATHKEAYGMYKFYMYRATVTFIMGIIASVIGLWLY